MKLDDYIGSVYVFDGKYHLYLGILKGYVSNKFKTKHFSMIIKCNSQNILNIKSIEDLYPCLNPNSIVSLAKKEREYFPVYSIVHKLNFTENYIDEFHDLVCLKIKDIHLKNKNMIANLHTSYYLQKESATKYKKYETFLNEVEALKIFI